MLNSGNISILPPLRIFTLCIFCSFALMSLYSVASSKDSIDNKNRQIAFMPDIHFHDIYANFIDGAFKGLPNSISGKNATIRTLSSELNSTRLFNENYFALLATLDDVAQRGIKLVALPGDFSDDGQPIHLRGLVKILNHYRKHYGITFFATPGNHDPVRPFDLPGGESDFLGQGGGQQRIYSKGANECVNYQTSWTTIKTTAPLNTICSEEIRHLGYQGTMELLADFGFYPQSSYIYWETPYSNYRQSNYNYQHAKSASDYSQRQYEICSQGTGGQDKKANYTHCSNVPDASYLVEPVEGLWLLAIDANVYIPKASNHTVNAENYSGSGNAGYNKMFSHKHHVITWIKDVVKRAEKTGKQLIAFSHFPMTEFYDGQSKPIADLFGQDKFQLTRKPNNNVSKMLANTGIKVHVGGHMHMNDTGVIRNKTGQFLFNIQAPSIAAYVPAYKIMTLRAGHNIEIETIVIDDVPRYAELFEHYQQEYKTLKKSNSPLLWNKEILSAKNYREFTQWHISELTRLRFLPREWPQDLRDILFAFNGQDMLILSQLDTHFTLEQLRHEPNALATLTNTQHWQNAKNKAIKLTETAKLKLSNFKNWTGFDLAVDFYRLRNAGQLALHDITPQRLKQYQFFTQLMAATNTLSNKQQKIGINQPLADIFATRFSQLFKILNGFQKGLPDEHFMLNTQTGEIQTLITNKKNVTAQK